MAHFPPFNPLIFNFCRHYFCTDVVDVLTMFREPSLADQEQILAWRQQYSPAEMQTCHFYALTLIFIQVCIFIRLN